MIETEDGIQFGGYIEKQIDKIDGKIEDSNTFLFSFKDNKIMKYSLKKNKHITLLTLEKLCNLIDCTPNDIVLFIKE